MTAAEALELAASGAFPDFCWLDSGTAPGASHLLGLKAEATVESDALDALRVIPRDLSALGSGAWIGWVDYELGVAEQLGEEPRPGQRPGLCLRKFSDPVRWVEQESSHHDTSIRGDWPLGPLRCLLAEAEYRAGVLRIQEHLRRGDSYQVNFSQPFEASWKGESKHQSLAARAALLYGHLRSRTPASMGALIASDPAGANSWILSNSPETLVEWELAHDRLLSCPIKGTRPRGMDDTQDDELRTALWSSAKDRAEHLMIVDMVRNDLARVALPGSVQAPSEPSLVTLPTVHHLVTRVEARVRPGVEVRELFRTLFPGASITGAPKRRTIEIIRDLERERRGVYCGAILVAQSSGVKVSIPIRTAVACEQGVTLRSGGGVVIDSDAESERQETWDKAAAFAGPHRP